MASRQFRVDIKEDVLTDLRERLKRTRWPDEIPGSGWDYGSNLAYVKELVDYWIEEFDWRKQEEVINGYSQYVDEVDGLDVHYIHERGKGPDPLPLLLIHGWPGSIVEFLDFIPLLTDPSTYGGDERDSFDVVAPSLPGYGFSGKPSVPGMGVNGMGDVFAKLMSQIGYESYVAQGGDWGASISSRMGFSHSDKVKAIHINMILGGSPYLGPGSRPVSDAEKQYLQEIEQWEQDEGAYGHIQGTKPQTLAYGLNDSPAGLAAWIVEKWRSWSDCGGDIESVYTKDQILTNVTLYWVTETINSSARIYYETRKDRWRLSQGEGIGVPTAVAVFPEELDRPVREWAERTYNVQRWTELPKGGHFAAMEEPQALAADMREFFRGFR